MVAKGQVIGGERRLSLLRPKGKSLDERGPSHSAPPHTPGLHTEPAILQARILGNSFHGFGGLLCDTRGFPGDVTVS